MKNTERKLKPQVVNFRLHSYDIKKTQKQDVLLFWFLIFIRKLGEIMTTVYFLHRLDKNVVQVLSLNVTIFCTNMLLKLRKQYNK